MASERTIETGRAYHFDASIRLKLQATRSLIPPENLRKIKRKRCQKLTIVIVFAWLLMNTDPLYARRTLGAMMASRLLRNVVSDEPKSGLSTIDAVTLIQAMNSNNRANDLNLLKTELELRRKPTQRQQTLTSPDTAVSNRQLPVPTPGRVEVIIAALLAFVAAVLTGRNPLTAAAAALIVIILAIIRVTPMNGQQKNSPLIKKLVIKKTVLPFVIPIPYKKKEKEIIYVYKKHHEKHKEEHKEEHETEDHESHESKLRYKKKKATVRNDNIADIIKGKDVRHKQKNTSGKGERAHLDKIEELVKEQDDLQNLIDKVVEDDSL